MKTIRAIQSKSVTIGLVRHTTRTPVTVDAAALELVGVEHDDGEGGVAVDYLPRGATAQKNKRVK